MNFGHKIAITYGAFVVFIISLVTFCVKQDDITLVSPDYYKKEIAYQDEIEKIKNTAGLTQPIQIEKAGEFLQITFPNEIKEAKGTLLFYRPSDVKLDFQIPLSMGEQGWQKVPLKSIAPGQWTIKLEWEDKGISYLKEEKIIL
jgi:hypothetical protein